jgi:hypothetical protein
MSSLRDPGDRSAPVDGAAVLTADALAEPAAGEPASAATPALPDDATVRALLARARADDDEALRRLLHGYVALRQSLGDVLAFLAAREGGAALATVPALVRARALVTPARRPAAAEDAA